MRQAKRVRTRCVTPVLLGVCAAFGLFTSAFALHPDLVGYDPSGHVRFASPAEADAKRLELIAWVWPDGVPTGTFPVVTEDIGAAVFSGHLDGLDGSLAARVDRLDADVAPYDFGAILYLVHPLAQNDNNQRMVLLGSGHRGTSPFAYGVNDLASRLLTEGFSVMMTDMPLVGFNTDNTIVLPDGGGTVTISNTGGSGTSAHREMFSKLTPPVLREGEIYRFFLEPFVQGINHFLATTPEAGDVSFAGLSGGGWSAHMIAAVDTRIRQSFPVAGAYPLYARPYGGGSDDTEQTYAPLYREIDGPDADAIPDTAAGVASWLEIFALGGYGSGRRQIQILNLYDTCCFFGDSFETYDDFVSGVVDTLGQGDWDFHSDATHVGHIISDDVRENVILPVLGVVPQPPPPPPPLPPLSSAALANPGFDVPDVGTLFNQVVPGWSEYSLYADGAGYWGYADSGFPTFTGGQAASLIFTEVGQAAWLFQSLGAVAASDVGKTFTLTADFGARANGGKLSTVNMTLAFRSGLSSVLGMADTQTLSSQATAMPFATQTATFTPAAGDIGTEVFVVLDMDPQSMSGPAGQRQWMADSVTLSATSAGLGTLIYGR